MRIDKNLKVMVLFLLFLAKPNVLTTNSKYFISTIGSFHFNYF